MVRLKAKRKEEMTIMAANKKITFENPGNIYIPNQPCYYSISDSDWDRIKRKILSYKKETEYWMNACFCFIGVMGSALLSYISLPLNAEEKWIKPVLLTVTIFTALMSLLCFVANKHLKSVHNSEIGEIQELIKEIDSKIASDTEM